MVNIDTDNIIYATNQLSYELEEMSKQIKNHELNNHDFFIQMNKRYKRFKFIHELLVTEINS